ncbi:hypothetical protein MP638_005142 [Amoeboaphelidium occidentale]|nr:hypothetical protein MP638_005142 [Amoeboaphelidium occidentale]
MLVDHKKDSSYYLLVILIAVLLLSLSHFFQIFALYPQIRKGYREHCGSSVSPFFILCMALVILVDIKVQVRFVNLYDGIYLLALLGLLVEKVYYDVYLPLKEKREWVDSHIKYSWLDNSLTTSVIFTFIFLLVCPTDNGQVNDLYDYMIFPFLVSASFGLQYVYIYQNRRNDRVMMGCSYVTYYMFRVAFCLIIFGGVLFVGLKADDGEDEGASVLIRALMSYGPALAFVEYILNEIDQYSEYQLRHVDDLMEQSLLTPLLHEHHNSSE